MNEDFVIKGLEPISQDILSNDNIDSNSGYIDEFIISIDTEGVSNIAFDSTKFKNGVDSMSELCGKITALVNVGITPSMALTYLSDTDAIKAFMEHNLKVSEINADANIKSAIGAVSQTQKMMV